MRIFLLLIGAAATVAILVNGHFHWQEKTALSSFKESSKASAQVQDEPKKEAGKEKKGKKSEGTKKLLAYTQKWPEEARYAFRQALDKDKPFKFAIIGSQVMGDQKSDWPQKLKKELTSTYGSENIDVQIYEYSMTSEEFIDKARDKDIAASKPDMVLYEPFVFNDSKQGLTTQESHRNLEKTIKNFKKTNENTAFILQPAHPAINSVYTEQTTRLRLFAQNRAIPYLDHWTEWQEASGSEIEKYIQPNGTAPNKDGQEIWYDYLESYFINR